MPKIKFKLYAHLREIANTREIEINIDENSTLVDALKILVDKTEGKLDKYIFNKKGDVRDSLIFVVDGKSLKGNEVMKVSINKDSQVAIFPPFSGGRT